ncbi:aminotransferase class I/II-fold pyridoxal phosphate-dependent enzyme [Plantactinospora sp. B5E13]|uniref:MalY/PatB family protein n=1 Tax=Plantactinospora sp. B5E13 TaxID=3153758 RepID=UPI00325E9AE9
MLRTAPDDVLRQRTGIKWSRVSPGELPADIAELDFEVAEPVRTALRRAVELHDYGYPDFDQGTPVALQELFATRMHDRYGATVAPERVELSAQITQALCAVVLTLTRPGDGVLVHTPTYPPFLAAISQLGRRPVTVPVRDVEDAEQLTELLPPSVGPIRLIVLCHPHNPTGHVFNRTTLAALAEFTVARDAVVFSDEIYQDLVDDPATYQPVATVPGLADRTVTFTSAAKSFNVPGLRCAVGYFGGSGIHRRYTALPWHLRDGAGILGVAATLAAWRYGDAWLEDLRRTLRDNQALLVERLARLPGVAWTPPSAGYLGWLDLTTSSVAADPRAILRRRAGILLQAGAAFGAAFTGYARLNFGTDRDRLVRILDRLSEALR